jgi:hypothetical protein
MVDREQAGVGVWLAITRLEGRRENEVTKVWTIRPQVCLIRRDFIITVQLLEGGLGDTNVHRGPSYLGVETVDALHPVDHLRTPSHEGGAAAPCLHTGAKSEPPGARGPGAVASGGGVSHDSATPWAADASYRFALSPI